MRYQNESVEVQLPDELAKLERQLARFAPAVPAVDRDRLMFTAGRAAAMAEGPPVAVRPQLWDGARLWPAATALMTAATILLAATLAWQQMDERDRAKPQAVAVASVTGDSARGIGERGLDEIERWMVDGGNRQWATTGYLGLRHVALVHGVSAIGGRSAGVQGVPADSTPPATARELLDEFLPATGKASS